MAIRSVLPIRRTFVAAAAVFALFVFLQTWHGNFVSKGSIQKPHQHAGPAQLFPAVGPAVGHEAHFHEVSSAKLNNIEQRGEITITWDLAVQRGEQLMCQMMNTKEWAAKELIKNGKLQEGSSSQSQWTDPYKMAEYGWDVSTTTPVMDDTMQEGLRWVGAKGTYPKDSLVMAAHESPWTDANGSKEKVIRRLCGWLQSNSLKFDVAFWSHL